jgi:hypothetical protein
MSIDKIIEVIPFASGVLLFVLHFRFSLLWREDHAKFMSISKRFRISGFSIFLTGLSDRCNTARIHVLIAFLLFSFMFAIDYFRIRH